MFQELRIYTLKPADIPTYVDHFEQVGLPIIRKYAALAGFWTTEFGDLNEIYHLWTYQSFDQRRTARAALHRDDAWQRDFTPLARELVIAHRNVLLMPTSFSPEPLQD